MFTGLVEEVGRVKVVIKGPESAKITIGAKKVLEDIKYGDSIATNGVCLTAVDFTSDSFTAQAMAETFFKTNLKSLKPGDMVNLERALRLTDRLGGHIVSGHVDGTGRIRDFKNEDIAVWITIDAPSDILRYIVYKGSVAIDGISLTVADVDKKSFKVSVIPHTKNETALLYKKIGDEVNLECDVIGKYVEKMVNVNRKDKGIDIDFLKENGFLL